MRTLRFMRKRQHRPVGSNRKATCRTKSGVGSADLDRDAEVRSLPILGQSSRAHLPRLNPKNATLFGRPTISLFVLKKYLFLDLPVR